MMTLVAWAISKIGLRGIIMAVAGIAIAAIVGGFWLHYNGIVKDNARLAAEVAASNIKLQVQKTTIENLQRVNQEWKDNQARLEQTLTELREVEEATREDNRQVHDETRKLEQLDATDAEALANSSNARFRRLLECASGRYSSCGDRDRSPTSGNSTGPKSP